MCAFRSNRHSIALVPMLIALSGFGCVSWHVETVSPESLLANRKPTTVRVRRGDGSRIVVQEARVRADTLTGIVSGGVDNQMVTVPLTNIRQIETPRSNGEGTSLLVGGVVVTVAVAIWFVTQLMALSNQN